MKNEECGNEIPGGREMNSNSQQMETVPLETPKSAFHECF